VNDTGGFLSAFAPQRTHVATLCGCMVCGIGHRVRLRVDNARSRLFEVSGLAMAFTGLTVMLNDIVSFD